MASSYSSDLKLELMATGENAGTWGDKTNTNLNLIQQAIAGFEQVTLSSGGTLALAMSDATLSNARNMVIKFATATIAASTVCTIPDSIEKFYIFDCTGLTNPTNLTIKTASGTGFSPDAAKIYAAYADGTNLNEVSLDTLGGTVAAAQIADGAVTTDKIGDDQVTYAKMQDTSTDNRVLGATTAGEIGEVQVQSAMIADDAVGADQLANTAVTAGDYTVASITVDAQGRVTAASSGAAGGGGFAPFRNTSSGSGTHTTQANASKMMVYLRGGGGGGGGQAQWTGQGGGEGGFGGYGLSVHDCSGSQGHAYSLGNGGSPGNAGNPGNAGSAGNASNFGSPSTFITANAGNAGNGGRHPNQGGNSNPGSPGNHTINSGNHALGSNYSPSGLYTLPASTQNGGNNQQAGGTGHLFVFESI